MDVIGDVSNKLKKQEKDLINQVTGQLDQSCASAINADNKLAEELFKIDATHSIEEAYKVADGSLKELGENSKRKVEEFKNRLNDITEKLKEAENITFESEEVSNKMRSVEEELKIAEDRFKIRQQKLKQLEENLKIVNNSMQSLDASEEKAREKAEKLKSQLDGFNEYDDVLTEAEPQTLFTEKFVNNFEKTTFKTSSDKKH